MTKEDTLFLFQLDLSDEEFDAIPKSVRAKLAALASERYHLRQALYDIRRLAYGKVRGIVEKCDEVLS